MTQSNIKIAITGGIGSGKSTVAEIIKCKGYAVFSCDKIYDELLKDNAFLKKLSKEFGGVLTDGGDLNRTKLAEIVFNDKETLKRLNALTHPAIMKKVKEKCKGEAISFVEVPLLFENGFEKVFNGVIVVLRDKEERISATVKRDGTDRAKVILRINSQLDYENCDFTQYYVLHNDRNLADLTQKTEKILKKIKSKYF